MKSTVYILCGLPGSGKTTYAKKLESEDTVRFTLDEELFLRFGKDFSPSLYPKYEEKTKNLILKNLKQEISKGNSVILDFGFWKKSERTNYKELIESMGAKWKLLYFATDVGRIKTRIKSRNQNKPESNHVISSEMLDEFVQQFEPPSNEREIII